MRQEDIWDEERAQRYDTAATGMFAPEVLGPAGAEFTAESRSHVSVYRLPAAAETGTAQRAEG